MVCFWVKLNHYFYMASDQYENGGGFIKSRTFLGI
jgi:hypothetical protein